MIKFNELYKTLDVDTRIVINNKEDMLPYKAEDLYADCLFYEEIYNKTVTEIRYSRLYQAIVIKVE